MERHSYPQESKMKSPLFLAFVALLAASGLGSFAPGAPPAATGSCRLVSADDVSKALHVPIVRVEPAAEDKSVCEYSMKGKPSSAATDHAIAMAGAMNGQALDPAAQKLMQGFGNAMLGGQDADAKNFRHAGEVPILVIDVQTGDAISQMKVNRQALGYMQPVTPISGLGDEAFSSSDSMMFVRKGDKLVHIVYTGCPCTTKDVEPLARQIVGAI
jgi:hypothetical protein